MKNSELKEKILEHRQLLKVHFESMTLSALQFSMLMARNDRANNGISTELVRLHTNETAPIYGGLSRQIDLLGQMAAALKEDAAEAVNDSN